MDQMKIDVDHLFDDNTEQSPNNDMDQLSDDSTEPSPNKKPKLGLCSCFLGEFLGRL